MELISQAEFARRAGVTRQRVHKLLSEGAFGQAAKRIDGRVVIDFEAGCQALRENLDPRQEIKAFQKPDTPKCPDLPDWPEVVHLEGSLSPLASTNLGRLVEHFLLPDLDPTKAVNMLLEHCQGRYPEVWPDW